MATLVATPFAEGLAERLRAPRTTGVTLYWIGQAGFVVDACGYRVLIDPYLSDTLATKYAETPYPHERMMAVPLSVGDLGRVDLVLVTHHHTDHMDPGTLAPLAQLHPKLTFVVPRAALAQARERIGVAEDRIRPLDAGDTIEPLAGVLVRAVRAAHEKLERDEAGHHRFLGYGLSVDGVTLLHSGDTIPFEGQREEIAGVGADVALLPVNGRSDELRQAGFAGNFTIDEAIALCRACGIGTLLAHHYGMFAFNSADAGAIDEAAGAAPLTVERTKLQIAYHVARRDAPREVVQVQDELRSRETTQNILEVVRTLRQDLRKSERKVADLVLAESRRLLTATLAETADLAGVSQPTVIRFCVAVGCTGFQDLKLRLAHSLALGTPATHSVLLDTDQPEAIVEKIFDYTISSLDWARHHLDKSSLTQAIGVLEKAASIEFFGYGASGIVARDAQQKFPLFGVPCGAQVDTHQQIMVASMMRPGDVAVVISNTGRTLSMIEIARVASAGGATVIGITGSASPLADECHIALIVESLDNTNIYTPTISRIAALVVIDVLSTAVALRRGSEHQARFQVMKRRLNELRLDTES